MHWKLLKECELLQSQWYLCSLSASAQNTNESGLKHANLSANLEHSSIAVAATAATLRLQRWQRARYVRKQWLIFIDDVRVH